MDTPVLPSPWRPAFPVAPAHTLLSTPPSWGRCRPLLHPGGGSSPFRAAPEPVLCLGGMRRPPKGPAASQLHQRRNREASRWPCHGGQRRAAGSGVESLALAPPAPVLGSLLRSHPAHSSPLSPIVCSAEAANPGGGAAARVRGGVWPHPSGQALICMQKGLGGIYRGLAPGSCSPLGTLSEEGRVQSVRLEQALLPLRTPWSLSRLPPPKSFSFITFLIIRSQRGPALCDSGHKNGPIIWKRREQLRTVRRERQGTGSGLVAFFPAFSHRYFYSC